MKGVVAAGHPLTAQAGADVLRAGGNAVDAAVAAVLMSFVAESPLTGPGAGGFMVVHAGGGVARARLLRRRSRSRPRRSRARGARARGRPLQRGRRAALQRRTGVVRRLRHDARPGRDPRALRQRAARRPHRRAGPRRARGDRGGPDAGVPVRGAASDPHAHAGVRRDLRAGGAAPARGRHHPAARARRPARPARRGGSRVPLRRRRGHLGQRLGARARRHAQPRGPELVRGDRA